MCSLSSSFSFSNKRSKGTEYLPVSLHNLLPCSCTRRRKSRRIRLAGAEDPGRCPGPAASSSGLRLGPAVQPRGTASCPRSPSPETEHRAAPTRSQHSLCPVSKGRKRKREKTTPVQPGSLQNMETVSDKHFHFLFQLEAKITKTTQ